MEERPEAIVITISQAYLRHNYRTWLKNFLWTMNSEEAQEAGYTYWFRQGGKPKYPVEFLYLCIGGKVRYRVSIVAFHGAGEIEFSDGKKLYGKAWIEACGEAVAAPRPIPIQELLPYQKNSGFQGFRYCKMIF